MKPESNVMPAFARVARVLTVVALPFSVTACTWFTDFKNQPRLEPWESFSVDVNDTMAAPRFNPQLSVPVQGTTVSALHISYTPSPLVLDSMSYLVNPSPVTEASLENGRKHYAINCLVCHGELGDGNGPMKRLNPQYGFSPSLLTDIAKNHADGYIWGIMRNGRGLMPSYARIEDADRWDVVNYVRALQGKTDLKPVTGPLGMPGLNGATVPRASATAPQKPSPFAAPTIQLTPGSSGANAATTGRDKMLPPSGAGTAHDDDHDAADAAEEMFQ
ncbi:MAG TPA: cytochrome c [Gemmatimonadaceae bacterium]|nr:cytochrome c [Gemmatimonadaceae bacterium]